MRRSCFAIVVLPFAISFCAAQSAKEELDAVRAQELQHEVKKRAASIRALDACTEVEEALAAHASLEGTVSDLATRIAALLQSDEGKKIASQPPMVSAFQRLKSRFDSLAPSTGALENWKKTLVAYQSAAASQAKNPTADPDPNQQAGFRSVAGLVAGQRQVLSELAAALRGLVATAASLPPVTTETTLGAEIERIEAATSRAEAEVLYGPLKEAEEKGREYLVDALKFAALEKASARAEQEKTELLAELERQRDRLQIDESKREQKHAEEIAALRQQLADRDAELREKELATEVEVTRRVGEAEKKHLDELQKIQEERDLFEAELKARGIQVDIKKKRILEDAEKQKRIAQCQSAEVQTLLAPFITPGYWQPATTKDQQVFDRRPMSLSKIQSTGALVDKTNGSLFKLWKIAHEPDDTERPRWEKLHPAQVRTFAKNLPLIERSAKAQDLLSTLGPTLIELGMLSP